MPQASTPHSYASSRHQASTASDRGDGRCDSHPAGWARGHDHSYDNALAEAFNSLFKAELVRNRGPWKGIDDLEIAVAEYIDWFNHRRLHGEIGLVPPAEHEDTFYRHNTAATTVAASVPSLH